MKIISQEEIPGIHHRLANESEELGDSGSTRKKRSCSRIDHFEIHKAKCQLQSSMSNELVHISEESMSEVNNFEIHKAKCQLQSSMSNELVHISEESMSEVNNVQVPPESGPSSTPFKNKIDQNLKPCDTFGTSKFIESDQVQPIDQMFDYSHEHSLHVYSCPEKSIWELTYWDLI
ncbi:hypothetical protein AgCh_018691 [Apium graveolens]